MKTLFSCLPMGQYSARNHKEASWAAIYIPHFTSCCFLGKVTYFGAYVFFAIDSLKPIGKNRDKNKNNCLLVIPI